jgi:hypothetical protein
MALDGQFDKVIRKLTDLTRADKVVWQETVAEDVFLTVVGKSVVTVGLKPDRGPGYYANAPAFVRIHETGGPEVEVAVPQSDSDDWTRIKALVDFARNSVKTHSQKVVSDLLSTLEAIR